MKASCAAKNLTLIFSQDFMELMNTSPDSGLPIETLRYCLCTVLVIIKKIHRYQKRT